MNAIRHATAALALLAAAGFAYAQEQASPPPAPALPAADCPAPGTVPDASLPTECKQPAGQTKPEAGEDVTKTDAAPSGAMPAGIDAKEAFLASSFIGQTVYSAAGENVGEINDLILAKDKGAIVAVIGVGGFLGIGEKDVAIPIDRIAVIKQENANLKLTISATREELDAAPAFDRTALYTTIGG